MIIKNPIITPQLIESIKDSRAIIFLDNTKWQNPKYIKNIPQNIGIRVLGGYNFCNETRFLKPKYAERTDYSPKVLAEAITKMQEIENKIDPNWSDFTKALFVFETLVKSIDYDYDNKCKEEVRNLTCLTTGFSRCAGFAICFKEMMDRLDIKNEFRNIEGLHSYNILFYKSKPFVVDLTFARDTLNRKNGDYRRFFGAFDPHEFLITHIPLNDKYTDYQVFKPQTIKNCLNNILMTQDINCKK